MAKQEFGLKQKIIELLKGLLNCCEAHPNQKEKLAKEELGLKQEVIELLKGLLNYYGTYHNHKENMAWAGVVSYGAFLFTALTLTKDAIGTSLVMKLIVSAVLITLAIIAFLYVKNQLRLRACADEITLACSILIWDILRCHKRIDPRDLEPYPREEGFDDMLGRHALPRLILEKRAELMIPKDAKNVLRSKLEFSLICFFVIIALTALGSVWLTRSSSIPQKDPPIQLHLQIIIPDKQIKPSISEGKPKGESTKVPPLR